MQPRQRLVLAPHVVRTRSDDTERRPSYDDARVTDPDQVGEIGGPVRELPDLDVAVDAELLAEMGRDAIPVQVLAWAHRRELGSVGHAPSSRSSTAAYCARACSS